jgi:hypothetical protein
MSVQPMPPSVSPCDAVRTAPLRARVALTEQPARPMDAVAWMSAHLATVERMLLPRIDAVLHDDAGIAELRRLGAAVYVATRRLEQIHAGDGQLRRIDAARLRHLALHAIDEYETAEHRLVCHLSDQLDETERAQLASAYLTTLAAAPTRPHPHAPHRGLLGALAFRVDAARDRVLNTLDSRPVPIPRQPRRRTEPGRWTMYALGAATQPSDSGPAD